MQPYEKGLMARRMTRRRYDHNRVIPEHVVVAFQFRDWVLRLEAWPKRRWPLIFSLLHEQHRRREQRHIADMIRMCVRDREILDVRRLQPERVKLRNERLWPAPMSGSRV